MCMGEGGPRKDSLANHTGSLTPTGMDQATPETEVDDRVNSEGTDTWKDPVYDTSKDEESINDAKDLELAKDLPKVGGSPELPHMNNGIADHNVF